MGRISNRKNPHNDNYKPIEQKLLGNEHGVSSIK